MQECVDCGHIDKQSHKETADLRTLLIDQYYIQTNNKLYIQHESLPMETPTSSAF